MNTRGKEVVKNWMVKKMDTRNQDLAGGIGYDTNFLSFSTPSLIY